MRRIGFAAVLLLAAATGAHAESGRNADPAAQLLPQAQLPGEADQSVTPVQHRYGGPGQQYYGGPGEQYYGGPGEQYYGGPGEQYYGGPQSYGHMHWQLLACIPDHDACHHEVMHHGLHHAQTQYDPHSCPYEPHIACLGGE